MTENNVLFQQPAVECRSGVILGVMEVEKGMELLLEDGSLIVISVEKFESLFPPGSGFPRKATFTYREDGVEIVVEEEDEESTLDDSGMQATF